MTAAAPTPAAPAPAGQSPEQAYQLLMQRIHVPAFFNKLASFGVPVEKLTKAEADQYLEMGGKLRILHDHQLAKQAAAQGSALSRFNADLDNMLAANGLAQPGAAPAATLPVEVKQAARQVSANPSIFEAALVLLNQPQA